MRKAEYPVLVVGPNCDAEQHPLRSILFATNLETSGQQAAEYALALAKHGHGRLTLLHVVEKQPKIPGEEPDLFESALNQRLRKLLPTDSDILFLPKIRIEYGSPSEVIPAVAQSESASLVVVSLGKRSALADHASSATLSYIIREAKCGVLGVHDRLS